MARLTYRTKLLISHIGLVAVVLLLLSILLERSLSSDLESRRDEHLVEQARGATEWVSSGRHPNRVAIRLAAIVQADVTIFDVDDCVVGRSDSDSEDSVPRAPGKCVPPQEVADARATGVGRATRPIADDRMDYVAVPAEQGMVLRFGVSTREIEAPIAAIRARLVVAALIAAFLALVLGQLAAQIAARPLRSMARQADRIARGDYEISLPTLARDEFGQLSDTLAALARRLKTDMDRINKLEVTRRDFVANVAHELRTPVAAIQGYAETLKDGKVDAESGKRFVEMMHRYTIRLSGLVDGLLRLSELEAAEQQEIAREPVDVHAAALDIAQALRPQADSAKVSIQVEIAAECFVLGERTRLEQVLENLVGNAVKYGASPGTIRIRAHDHESHTRIEVIDDGPGIEEQHLDRLFERFYRVDAGRSRERGGAGLGLAIVKHLVESMGGSVGVESRLGEGTTFFVELETSVAPSSKRGSAGTV